MTNKDQLKRALNDIDGKRFGVSVCAVDSFCRNMAAFARRIGDIGVAYPVWHSVP